MKSSQDKNKVNENKIDTKRKYYVTIIHVNYLLLLVLLLKIKSIFAFFSTCILFYFSPQLFFTEGVC